MNVPFPPFLIPDVLSPQTDIKSTTATVFLELLRQVWVGLFSDVSGNVIYLTLILLVTAT